MTPYESVFLALATGAFFARPRFWWMIAAVPAIAFAIHWMFPGPFATPVAAVAACLLVPRYAPVAIVLAIPVYQDSLDVVRTALLWFVTASLMEGLEDRVSEDDSGTPVRRMSARLVCIAALYYTFRPVMYL